MGSWCRHELPYGDCLPCANEKIADLRNQLAACERDRDECRDRAERLAGDVRALLAAIEGHLMHGYDFVLSGWTIMAGVPWHPITANLRMAGVPLSAACEGGADRADA